jgi:voltage-gated potassium channel
MENKPAKKTWRLRLYEIIFESDTPAGKAFDVALLFFIMGSVAVIFLDSIPEYKAAYGPFFYTLEIFFTVVFTLEYILRLISVPKPLKYMRSFYGLIDLAAILPTYLAILFPHLHFLLVIRILRLLRVFRIFKMVRFLSESLVIVSALWGARRKILVFFFSVILITIVAGALMYVVEHQENEGFRSIPESIYWAIVTLTTVGYGDISPITPLGKFIASFIMLLGYCIIAVPTGIVSASLVKEMKEHEANLQTCPHCFKQGHDTNASFCKYCGHHL